MKQTIVTILSYQLNVTVALTRSEQEQGLKHQVNLSDNDGLLIILPEPIITGVWMKETSLPLSVAFIDKHFIIREIKQLKPFCEDYQLSQQPVQFILEVNQNWFEARQIKIGQTIDIKDIKPFLEEIQPRQIGFKGSK